ncbi:MAG: efflux RND transporter periplasmic adaptor subunit [Calditrichia bacterium]
MGKKIIFGIIGAIIILIIVVVAVRSTHHGEKNQFLFGQVTRGDIINTVSSTGSTSAVTNVEVGTQVSGTIVKIYADFNDIVRPGEVLAVLDTIPLKAAVLDAKAGVAQAEAQLQQAQSNYDRNLPLYKSNLISESDFLPIQTSLNVQLAALNSAQAALTRAQQNLDYAYIRSPIHGTVIQRNVDVGQTVAASFATPTLFIIAEDLTKMEILAQVDESDIGQIKVGQTADFTVAAFPDSNFEGKVEEIRLQPTVVQNVVNYTVVVSASNKNKVLLPGMTATLDFIIARRDNVLRVPNAALSYQPGPELLKEYQKSLSLEMESMPDTSRTYLKELLQNLKASGNYQSMMPGMELLPPGIGSVWYLNERNRLSVAFFKTGISDGINTAVLSGRTLNPGMQVITGINLTGQPIQPGNQNRARRFRMF